MPTTHEPCTTDVKKLAVEIMRKHHPDILKADVTITYVYAVNPDGVALRFHGWPAAAVVKINSAKHRVEGLDDCSITIDKAQWEDFTDEERTALLDHELYHIEVQHDEKGTVITDDANRPKLKLRPHDFQCAGFHEIVRRHGLIALEHQQVVAVEKKWEQMELNFAQPGAFEGAA